MGSVQSLVFPNEDDRVFPSEYDNDEDDIMTDRPSITPNHDISEQPCCCCISWKDDDTLILQCSPHEPSTSPPLKGVLSILSDASSDSFKLQQRLPRRLVIRGVDRGHHYQTFSSSITAILDDLLSLVSSSLEHLELDSLSSSMVESDNFWNVVSRQSFPRLTSLSLVGLSLENHDSVAVQVLSHLLKHPLQVLHLERVNNLMPSPFWSTNSTTNQEIMINPLSLRTLSMHNCNFHMSAIVDSLHNNHLALHSLRLSRDDDYHFSSINATTPSLSELSSFLQRQSSTLRHVHFDGLFSKTTTMDMNRTRDAGPSSQHISEQDEQFTKESWNTFVRTLQHMPQLTTLSLNDWTTLSSFDQEALVQSVAQGHFDKTHLQSLSLLMNHADGLSYKGHWIDSMSEIPLRALIISLGNHGCPRDDMHALDALAARAHHNTHLTTLTDEAWLPYAHHASIRHTIRRNRRIRRYDNLFLMGENDHDDDHSTKRIDDHSTKRNALPIHVLPLFWPIPEKEKPMDTYEVSALYTGLLARAPDLAQCSRRKKRSLTRVNY